MLWTGRIAMSPFAAPALDARALLFALGDDACATSVLCGLAPALETSRARLTHALKEDDRSGGGRRRLFRGLVVTEVALAVLLLAAAGLLLDELRRHAAAPPRLRQHQRGDLLGPAARIALPGRRRSRHRRAPAHRVEQVPGVESAAVNRCTPFTGCSRTVLFFSDRPNDPATAPVVGRHYVSADYFKTLGIPLRAGRVLTATRSSPAVLASP